MVQVTVQMDTIDLRRAEDTNLEGRHVDNLQGLLAGTRFPEFDPGPIDGLGGPRTRAAVIAFQVANGLDADAIVGPLTWGALVPFAGSSPGFDIEPVQGTGTGFGLLVDVRVAAHPGFDRVVFEFRDAVPGFRVRYVDPPVRADPSDEPVTVEGNAFVRVVMNPASSFDPDTGAPSFTGPVSGIGAGTSVVRDVVGAGDFEAVLHFVVGLATPVGFRVSSLSDPSRLVVDFATP